MPTIDPLYGAAFTIFNGCWIFLYILVIRRGFKDQTYGIPFVALTVNLAWDIIGAFVAPSVAQSQGNSAPVYQGTIDFFYVIIDLIIVFQVFRYWYSDMEPGATHGKRWQFYFFVVLALVFSLMLVRATMSALNDPLGVQVGFIDTFINSALFIDMFYRRSDLRGQSLWIGLAKLVGTGAMLIALTIRPWPGTEGSPILPVLFAGIFVLDLAYAILVYQRCQVLKINPWRRF
jgi:hypothetical protein